MSPHDLRSALPHGEARALPVQDIWCTPDFAFLTVYAPEAPNAPANGCFVFETPEIYRNRLSAEFSVLMHIAPVEALRLLDRLTKKTKKEKSLV